ncbi:hypothetical protein EGW08_000466 [Elysia chlorotica]|uniref:C2H2-type domain-containing protein n=1 Tax=Elysia chlorotica TaxID=188477 RepID=A0A3S1BY36_ELYCH|nr:hypothetical protein EGW08_000466 [Elysia chlorotica]
MSVKFQFSKLIMEKFLRRSFYDAVLRLYETAHGARIISVSLEGHLSLVVNKNENFVIKLNEIAQRADDGEDPHQQRLAKFINFKPDDNTEGYFMKKEDENTESYFVKKDDDFPALLTMHSAGDRSEVVVNLDDHLKIKDGEKFSVMTEESQNMNNSSRLSCHIQQDELGQKTSEQKESFNYKQLDNGATGSQLNHQHDQNAGGHSEAERILQDGTVPKPEPDGCGPTEICFLPVGQVNGEKRKLELDYHGQVQACDKKSPEKKRKLMSFPDPEEESVPPIKAEDKVKEELSATGTSDVNANSLQLLPHTAIAPIVVEEEDSNYGPDMDTGEAQQQQQLATMFQLRDQVRSSSVAGSVGMFRQQDLEELARQQQQWQMVAYQRSIMEKSYLQQQLQQYQRDSERLRWEFTTQQQQREERITAQAALPSQQSPVPRDLVSNGGPTNQIVDAEMAEKLYRQAQANTEAALLAAAALEQAKKTSQDGQVGVEDAGAAEKLSAPHYIRMLEEHVAPTVAVPQAEAEYEEGELRHDTHICVLCGIKFMALEPLIRHMEKHRKDFERSCSVCQSGTLTGNMLKLHMEASHGPETSFPLPPMAVPVASVITSSSGQSTSSAPELTQSFHAVLQGGYSSSLQLDLSGLKLPHQSQVSLKQVTAPLSKEQEDMMTAVSSNNAVKPEEPYEYQDGESLQLSCHAEGDGSSSVPDSNHQEHESYLGLAQAQFYPLIACQVCGEKFALSEALDQHVESQHKDSEGCTYTCKPCALSFDTHVEYSKHSSRHEASVASMTLQANTLSSSSSTSSATAVAPTIASSASVAAQLKCSHCLKAFKSVKQLRLHYVAAHACCHFCEYCRAGFPDSMSLQLHEQLHTLDPDKLSFRCDICSKAFFTQSQCSAHKRTHKDEKAHACDVCGSSFFKRGDLTKHVRTVHSPSRLFSCKFCGKKGTRMDNMRSHVRSHHKSMTRDQIVNMIEVIE